MVIISAVAVFVMIIGATCWSEQRQDARFAQAVARRRIRQRK